MGVEGLLQVFPVNICALLQKQASLGLHLLTGDTRQALGNSPKLACQEPAGI